MLTLLKIRNLALVDELAWELGSGLISVTGETGAGKSVIVGALKMILGERADKGLIRTGEDTCTIESVFDLKDAGEINAILEEGGLAPCDDTQIILHGDVAAGGLNTGVQTKHLTQGWRAAGACQVWYTIEEGPDQIGARIGVGRLHTEQALDQYG